MHSSSGLHDACDVETVVVDDEVDWAHSDKDPCTVPDKIHPNWVNWATGEVGGP